MGQSGTVQPVCQPALRPSCRRLWGWWSRAVHHQASRGAAFVL